MSGIESAYTYYAIGGVALGKLLASSLRYIVATAAAPLVALGVALWGSTWGWNADGKLVTEFPTYLLASYLLFGVPFLVLRTTSATWVNLRIMATTRSRKLGPIAWGAFVVSASVLLIHGFDSAALWLGTMSDFYLGFFSVVAGVIRLLAT